MASKMETSNQRICSFYKEHSFMNFETINLMFIDLFEKLIHDACPQNANVNLHDLKTTVSSLKDAVTSIDMNITDKIVDFQKENAVRQQITHAKIINEVSDLFKRNQTAAEISNINHLTIILNQLYNTAEIVRNELHENSQIFFMKRHQKPSILFECKDIERNVNTEEIALFTKLMEEKNCHGVFISNHSGFSSKPNYHIEYHRGNIAVFIHNAEYCPDKIKIAVNIIDTISVKLKELNSGNDENTIPKAVLDDINKEYQLFISQKEAVISVYKDCQKKVLSQIDEICFPCLDKYLSTKYTNTSQKQGFKCDLCKCYNANNLKALAAHKRGCARKNVFVTAPLHAAHTVTSHMVHA